MFIQNIITLCLVTDHFKMNLKISQSKVTLGWFDDRRSISSGGREFAPICHF
jgi:hypothetical protein